MRRLLAISVAGLMATFVCSSIARAQAGDALNNTLYTRLNKDPSTGGPAPARDLSGAWAGPLNAVNTEEIPPLTPRGQKLFGMNKPEAKFGTSGSNDPLNYCDPLGMPRNLVFETRGLAFSTMPGKVVVLHQYQKVWREVWMDGRELPKNIDTKGGPESRWYGYSVGHWEDDHTLVIDSTGSDDRSWLDTAGHPHSTSAHIQEKYVRADHNHLSVIVTVDDPTLYTKPFVLARVNYRWIPSQETEDQFCIPSEAISYMQSIAEPAGPGSPK